MSLVQWSLYDCAMFFFLHALLLILINSWIDWFSFTSSFHLNGMRLEMHCWIEKAETEVEESFYVKHILTR